MSPKSAKPGKHGEAAHGTAAGKRHAKASEESTHDSGTGKKRKSAAPTPHIPEFDPQMYHNVDGINVSAYVGKLEHTAVASRPPQEAGAKLEIPKNSNVIKNIDRKYAEGGLSGSLEHYVEFLEMYVMHMYAWAHAWENVSMYNVKYDMVRITTNNCKKMILDNLPGAIKAFEMANRNGVLDELIGDLSKCLKFFNKEFKRNNRQDFFTEDSPIHKLYWLRHKLTSIYFKERILAIHQSPRLCSPQANDPETFTTDYVQQLSGRMDLLLRPDSANYPPTAQAPRCMFPSIPTFRADVYSNPAALSHAARFGGVCYAKLCPVILVGENYYLPNLQPLLNIIRLKYIGCEGCLEHMVELIEATACDLLFILTTERSNTFYADLSKEELRELSGATRRMLISQMGYARSVFRSINTEGDMPTRIIEAYDVQGVFKANGSEAFEKVRDKICTARYILEGSLQTRIDREIQRLEGRPAGEGAEEILGQLEYRLKMLSLPAWSFADDDK